MTENLKRFRIEFTVDVHHEGVTKDWDWSNDDIKHFALQELECMSPYPLDITFSEIGSPWYTGIPTEEGWYLFKWHDDKERWFTIEYLTIEGIKKKDKWNLFNDCKWRRIEENEV